MTTGNRENPSEIVAVATMSMQRSWKSTPDCRRIALTGKSPKIERQMETVLSEWIASDRAEGNLVDLPLTPIFPEGWQLG